MIIEIIMKLKLKIRIHKLLESTDKLLRKFGLSLTRVREKRVDSKSLTDGRSLIYKTGLNPVMAKVPLGRARILTHSLNSDSRSHINVLALKEALKESDQKKRFKIIEGLLNDYCDYNMQYPYSIAEMFAMNKVSESVSEEFPPWFFIYPWANSSDLDEKIRLTNFSTLVENIKRGGPRLNADEGGAQHYPTNTERAAFEARLLLNLLSSIERKGYKPDPGNHDPVGAVLLVASPDKWCWMVSGGIHRCCVLSALGYKDVDVSVKSVIYREDVADWPNVKNGFFSKEEALIVFDRVLSGSPPIKYQNWVENKFSVVANE